MWERTTKERARTKGKRAIFALCSLVLVLIGQIGCRSSLPAQANRTDGAAANASLGGLTVKGLRADENRYDKYGLSLQAVVVEESRDDAIGPSYLVLADDSVAYWASPQRANNDYKSETDCVLVSPKPQSIAPGDVVTVQGKYDAKSNTISLVSIKDLGQHNSQAQGGQMALPDPGNNH